MILEPNMSGARQVSVGGFELVLAAVRVLARFGPQVQVRLDNLLAVEHDRDQIVRSGNLHSLPLAGWLGDGFGWSQAPIE